MNAEEQLEMMERQQAWLLSELLRLTLAGARPRRKLVELHQRTVQLRRELERFLEAHE